jgi:uncharacterized protein (UPF0548 family)
VTEPELWKRPVSYGAVGGTQADDLLTFPPAGYKAAERRVRLGFGEARWTYAWTSTLSWAIQRSSGFTVERSDTPPHVSELTYTPVGFDEYGTPIQPASIDETAAIVGPDGTPFVRPGDSVDLRSSVGPLKIHAPVRVVYVIDEPNRKGFAYGTLAGHPVSGEEAWIVDRTPDGSVWLTIRSFSRPSRWYSRLGQPATRLMQRMYTRRYERALAGPIAE